MWYNSVISEKGGNIMTEGLSLLQSAFSWAATAVPGGSAAIWAGIIVAVGVGALAFTWRKFKSR